MSRKKKHDHVNHERWLVSYADFITLLFAFFVVLFASSQSDKRKAQQVEHAIHSAFQTMGIFPATSTSPNLDSIAGAPNTATVVMGEDLDASPKTMADLQKMKARLDNLLAEEIAHRTVTVEVGRDGLVISLRAAGFFETASATPIPDSMHTLLAIGSALAVTPYDVRIEGHTDNVPIHDSEFPSNWELSTGRATKLAQIFIENSHVAPSRLSAAGYAEYHPIASNATAEGRSRNRRVDIIVLPHIDHREELFFGKDVHKRSGSPKAIAQSSHAAPAMPASVYVPAMVPASLSASRPTLSPEAPTKRAEPASIGQMFAQGMRSGVTSSPAQQNAPETMSPVRRNLLNALYSLHTAVEKPDAQKAKSSSSSPTTKPSAAVTQPAPIEH
ncbi:MAG TPA: flagellar motor protein MotB [Acidobacteriaceae bacterium]|jgi:chemotaxis protein MotB|nr:flagellar motor protein MotB [Acidobacteriaceae bacterium]